MRGKVYLVGAGPGNPELLTLKALRLLQKAEVVLHDELVSPEILALAKKTALICNVGKRAGCKHADQPEINTLLVTLARAGFTVLRLKGGDPGIFGRAGEEIEALRQAGIDYEIVPGITAACAAAAAAGISLTRRESVSSVVFAPGCRAGESRQRWRPIADRGATVVIYMPGRDLGVIKEELLAAGFKPATACIMIACVSTRWQAVHQIRLSDLAAAPEMPRPAILIVGDAADSYAAFTATPESGLPIEFASAAVWAAD